MGNETAPPHLGQLKVSTALATIPIWCGRLVETWNTDWAPCSPGDSLADSPLKSTNPAKDEGRVCWVGQRYWTWSPTPVGETHSKKNRANHYELWLTVCGPVFKSHPCGVMAAYGSGQRLWVPGRQLRSTATRLPYAQQRVTKVSPAMPLKQDMQLCFGHELPWAGWLPTKSLNSLGNRDRCHLSRVVL
jgi:hypothetical protein